MNRKSDIPYFPEKYAKRYNELKLRLKNFGPESIGSPWHKKTQEEYFMLKEWEDFFKNAERSKTDGSLGRITREIMSQFNSLGKFIGF